MAQEVRSRAARRRRVISPPASPLRCAQPRPSRDLAADFEEGFDGFFGHLEREYRFFAVKSIFLWKFILMWSPLFDSNELPAHYECAALPGELRRLESGATTRIRTETLSLEDSHAAVGHHGREVWWTAADSNCDRLDASQECCRYHQQPTCVSGPGSEIRTQDLLLPRETGWTRLP